MNHLLFAVDKNSGFLQSKIMDSQELFDSLNRGMTAERLCAFKRNVEKNLPLIRAHGGLRSVVPLLRRKAAVIAGAGPSLEESLPVLRKIQHAEDMVIIAADMALKPLLKNGIRPGFVISCETRPAPFFAGADTSSHLLAFSCMNPSCLRMWKGPVSFYNWMLHTPDYDPLWERAGLELGFAATASIVTTQAVSIALGCEPACLILAGNDMGFRHRFYASGTFREDSGRNRVLTADSMEKERLRAAGNYEIWRGGQVFYTNHQFLAAKLWLEQLFREYKCPVYDCSVPGCSETSVIKTKMADLFNINREVL